jgi:intraflagellar transport protein 172
MDFSRDEAQRDFTSVESSPSGQSLVFGSYNKLSLFNYSTSRSQWEESTPKIIENFYSVAALAWKPDGSRLAVVGCFIASSPYKFILKLVHAKGQYVWCSGAF